jgi:hypothetical protein
MSNKTPLAQHSRVFIRIHRHISSLKLSLHRLTLLLRTAESLSFTADRELKLKVISQDITSLRQLLEDVMPHRPAKDTHHVDTLVDGSGRSRSRSASPARCRHDYSPTSENRQRKSHSSQISDTQLLVDDTMSTPFSAGLTLDYVAKDKSSPTRSGSASPSHQYSFVPLSSNPQFLHSSYIGVFDRYSSSGSSTSSDSEE